MLILLTLFPVLGLLFYYTVLPIGLQLLSLLIYGQLLPIED